MLKAAILALLLLTTGAQVPQDTSTTPPQTPAAAESTATAQTQPLSGQPVPKPFDWAKMLDIAVPALVAILLFVLGIRFEKRRHRKKLEAEKEFKEREEQTKARTAEEHYRYALRNEVCQIHMTAPGLSAVPVELNDTFVHLSVSEHARSEAAPRLGDPAREGKVDDNLKPAGVLQRAFRDYNHRLLLIIGDPGSGKTTLLKYYTLICLDGKHKGKNKDKNLDLGIDKPVAPFYLPLRELDTNKSLAANLAAWAQNHDAPVTETDCSRWLERRTALVLLDGLDEISQVEARKAAVAWIDKRCAGLKHHYFVVTSRSTGYRPADNIFLQTAHLRADVCDFSRAQKEEFLDKWLRAACQADSRPRKDESEAEWRRRRLQAAAKYKNEIIAFLEKKENRSLRELAGIPMLLQLMALIWKAHGARPESRTKLYDVALDYLLEYRDDQRGLAPLLKAEPARRVLQPAALWMQETLGADEAPKPKLHQEMQPYLQNVDNRIAPQAFCENLRDRAGILADYGKNEYIFRHKSFREYFAGLRLATGAYKENGRLQRLVETFGEAWWQEPLRYFISRADSDGFTAFFAAFFAADASRELGQTQQDLLQSLVRDAAEKPIDAFAACLRDASKNDNQYRYALDCLKLIGGEPVRQAVVRFIDSGFGSDATRTHSIDILIPLESEVETFEIREIVYTLFRDLPPSFRNHVEEHAEYLLIRGGSIDFSVTGKRENVPDFYLAKYPVTNKQYRRFIRYLGGDERDLAARVAFDHFSQKLLEYSGVDDGYRDYLGADPAGWEKKLVSKYDDDRKFNGDDQPVVGVSWFDASSYAFWLSLLAASELGVLEAPADKIAGLFRLPWELEWERAAVGRFEDGPPRKYPWPDEKGEPNERLANYGEKVGQTTPVGRYPEGATPEGLHDLAGNVWEWHQNWYEEKKARALRGGSWLSNSSVLRASNRYGGFPGSRDLSDGFRLLRAKSDFDTLLGV